MTIEGILKDSVDDLRAENRTFDTRAQIAIVGYVFSLGVLGQIDSRLSDELPISFELLIGAWAIFMAPIAQFGLVLYPNRPNLLKMLFAEHNEGKLGDLSRLSEINIVEALEIKDNTTLLAGELIQLERVRMKKRQRFITGMYMILLAYLGLFASQMYRI